MSVSEFPSLYEELKEFDLIKKPVEEVIADMDDNRGDGYYYRANDCVICVCMDVMSVIDCVLSMNTWIQDISLRMLSCIHHHRPLNHHRHII